MERPISTTTSATATGVGAFETSTEPFCECTSLVSSIKIVSYSQAKVYSLGDNTMSIVLPFLRCGTRGQEYEQPTALCIQGFLSVTCITSLVPFSRWRQAGACSRKLASLLETSKRSRLVCCSPLSYWYVYFSCSCCFSAASGRRDLWCPDTAVTSQTTPNPCPRFFLFTLFCFVAA